MAIQFEVINQQGQLLDVEIIASLPGSPSKVIIATLHISPEEARKLTEQLGEALLNQWEPDTE